MSEHVSQPPYFIGIDAGTEALKAGLFDLEGHLVASGSRRYTTHFPRPGWAEQDPKEWWDSLVGAVRDCLAAAPNVRAEEVLGISADATCCTLIPMTADGRELRRCFLWMDVRANEQALRIFETGHPALQYCLAGVNAEWMPPKMLWFKENEPELWAQMDVLLEFTSWIAYKLTGRFALDISCSSHRWFYHLPSGGWPEDFFATIGLEGITKRFPKEVLKVGDVVGPLSAAAAEALGLRAGTIVATGGADAFIGLLGQGVTAPGDMGAITGTSNVMVAMSTTEFHTPGIFGSFPDSLIPGLNLAEGGQVTTGAILTWYRRNFAAGVDDEAARRGISVYEVLDGEAMAVDPGSDGLIVLDYFQGNRTPHTDSRARGAIWGLTLQHSRGHIYRALMEGVAYGMQDILETYKRNQIRIERVIFSGGATRSATFMQIYADVLGQPIYTTREIEACLLGSAIVAAKGAGHFPTLPAASAAMVEVSGVTQPDDGRHAAYEFYVKKYQGTYPRLKELMHDMTAHNTGSAPA